MKDIGFLDLLGFFCWAIPAFLIALALWSVAIGVVGMVLLAIWASAA